MPFARSFGIGYDHDNSRLRQVFFVKKYMNLLIYLSHERRCWNISQQQIEHLQQAFHHWNIVWAHNDTMFQQALSEAEAVYCFQFPVAYIPIAQKLRWISTPAAGNDWIYSEQLHKTGITFTTSQGFHGITMSEWALGMLLMLRHRLHYPFTHEPQYDLTHDLTTRIIDLQGQTLLIIGCGTIGTTLAERARAFGMHTWGMRRQVPPIANDPIERWFDATTVMQALPYADFIVDLLPSTPETLHWFTSDIFQHFKPGCIFMNLGRGSTVDQEALLKALQEERIAQAVLDVTDPEPLPATHPLLNHPRVIVTPHVSACSEAYLDRALVIQKAQMQRVDEGKPLINRVFGSEMVAFR